MYLSTVAEWLVWIERIHPTDIELGLDRVKEVAGRLNLLVPTCPVIIVGGTNGKGSSVFSLESIYHAAGYRTGAFISPILFKHNEQVRLQGQMASDEAFCKAFEKVEAARGEITLTPFEFYTLAALSIFKTHSLDVLILEVGLGGRLDAVNILDADVAIVTSISIDHVNWLGDTREKIGYEKAGIFRSYHPAVCGDTDPPMTLINHATDIGAMLYVQGQDFTYQEKHAHWSWQHKEIGFDHLPINGLALQNMSSVLMAVTLLQASLAVTQAAIVKGLSSVNLPGRIQIIEGRVTEIYDVSHNPAAVALLSERLKKIPHTGKTIAVFSMLADKDIRSSLLAIRDDIDFWYVAPLKTQRGASKAELASVFQQAKINKIIFTPSVVEAYREAKKFAKNGDRIIIFGSFHTISEVQAALT